MNDLVLIADMDLCVQDILGSIPGVFHMRLYT